MKNIRCFIFIFILGFFIQIISVSAKEIELYFYADGGDVSTPGFSVNEYGDFITYEDAFSTTYKDSNKITHINSISGKVFTITKSGTSLVKGKEWYFKNTLNNKTYLFSESKNYTVDSIFKSIGIDNEYYSIDLYPNWQSNPQKGIDVKSTSSGGTTPTTTTTTSTFTVTANKTSIYEGNSVQVKAVFQNPENTENVTWSTSDKSIATVGTKGAVKGIKAGTVTITGTSASGLKSSIKITVLKVTKKDHKVQIEYHANGGVLSDNHGSKITLKNDIVYCDGNSICTFIVHGDTTSTYGLANVSNSNRINLSKDGYHFKSGSAWNTKKDGTGTSYSQSKIYQSTDFCDASSKDCKVVLYANWVKDEVTTVTFNPQNNAVTAYFNDSSRNVSNAYSKNKCGASCGDDCKIHCDLPNSYTTKLKGKINLYSYKDSKQSLLGTYDSNEVTYYMLQGNTYYLESVDNPSKFEVVQVKSTTVKSYEIPGIRNFRDLGGWSADGGKVRYGLIYRTANPNPSSSELSIYPQMETIIRDKLKIKAVLDLRSETSFNNVSKYYTTLTKYNTPIYQYILSLNDLPSGKDKSKYVSVWKSVKTVMESVVSGKSIMFHCAVGTDRTGTVAYLLEGILGVSENQRLDDYELSYFYRQESDNGLTRKNGNIKNLQKRVDKFSGSGQEKFMNWFLSESKNKKSDLELMNKFRTAMINGNPKQYTLSSKNLVKVK